MEINTTRPTRGEVNAAEKVLAEAHSQPCDGYWRSLAEAALEAAKDAQLSEFAAEVDAFELATGQGRR
jgi:hypothetical protein